MNKETEEQLKYIKSRWEDNMVNVCEECMVACIRHFDRNMGPACDESEYKEDEHPGRYDGDVYAYAGGDIKILIDIIEKLRNELERK